MKKFILLLLVCNSLSGFSQISNPIQKSITERRIQALQIDVMKITGGINFIPAKKAMEALNIMLSDSSNIYSEKDKALLNANTGVLEEFYNDLHHANENLSRIATNDPTTPFLEIYEENKQNTLIISGMYYMNSLNNYALNEDERIEYIMEKFGLPMVYKLSSLTKLVDVNKICLFITYSSKDFRQKYGIDDIEFLSVNFDLTNLKNFLEAKITKDEFLKGVNTYYNNGDMGLIFRKIR